MQQTERTPTNFGLLLKVWSFLNTILNFIEHTQFSIFLKICDLHSDANYLFGPFTLWVEFPGLNYWIFVDCLLSSYTFYYRLSDLKGMLQYIFQITFPVGAWTFFQCLYHWHFIDNHLSEYSKYLLQTLQKSTDAGIK
jgi:hypothetical protein